MLAILFSGPVAVSDKASIWSGLLLRIDSLVLTSMITTEEASNLRELIINNKVIVADSFSDIQQKGDAELLGEIRHFAVKSKQYGICKIAYSYSSSTANVYRTSLSCINLDGQVYPCLDYNNIVCSVQLNVNDECII